jgi:hypothetical protein
MRPSRVIAIARRDLALELSGRRGWVLPLILLGLLFPTTMVRVPMPNRPSTPPSLRVSGDIPTAVHALDVVVDDGTNTQLAFRREDGVTIVRAKGLRDDVRAALDGDSPALRVQRAVRPIRLPGRSLLFALISASTLTGAVSTSMAGERAGGTLVGLLAAAVTRLELIAGKWLAWGGLGAMASLLAAVSAVLMGRVVPGWWLLPLPIVAPATVALGFWLVRRATDVITGTTVSLRVLPAVLSITGLAAWFLGRIDPLLGASVPLGGALVAAGGTWEGALPAVVAFASSLTLSLVCLAATARDLEDAPTEPLPGRTLTAAALTTALAAGAWWLPTVGPVLWGEAGNPTLTEELPRAAGVFAGGLGLGLLALNGAASTHSVRESLGLGTGWRSPRIAVGVLVGLLLGALPGAGWLTLLTSPLGSAISARLTDAVAPSGMTSAAAVAVILGHELFFRGWVQHRWGPVVAVVAYTVVVTPTDPVVGLLIGGLMSALVHAVKAGSWPALLAHATWVTLLGLGAAL